MTSCPPCLYAPHIIMHVIIQSYCVHASIIIVVVVMRYSPPIRFGIHRGCNRGASCTYAHEPTNFSRFLQILGGVKQTLDICVFTITNDDIANLVLAAHQRGVSYSLLLARHAAITTATAAAGLSG